MTTIRWELSLILVGACLVLAPHESLAQKRQRDKITREEILGSAHKNADMFQVIRDLRPQFLEPPRGVRTLGGSAPPGPIAVYVDGRREPGVDALRLMLPADVDEVRFLDATRSENEYGPMVNGGALVVKLYKGPPKPPAPVRDTTKPP